MKPISTISNQVNLLKRMDLSELTVEIVPTLRTKL
jgi:hypothetical protein